MGIGAGHVGLVVGAKAHAKLWPEVTRWTAGRSTLATPASSPRVKTVEQPRPLPARRPAKRGGDHAPVWWANR
jgi:hypothetical protein